MSKRHDYVLRMTASQATIDAPVSKRLKAVRSIRLREYHITGLAAAPQNRTWMLRLGSSVISGQTSSFGAPGFAFPLCPTASTRRRRRAATTARGS